MGLGSTYLHVQYINNIIQAYGSSIETCNIILWYKPKWKQMKRQFLGYNKVMNVRSAICIVDLCFVSILRNFIVHIGRGVSSMVLFMLEHPPANEQKLRCVRRCPVLVCLSLVFLLSTAI